MDAFFFVHHRSSIRFRYRDCLKLQRPRPYSFGQHAGLRPRHPLWAAAFLNILTQRV